MNEDSFQKIGKGSCHGSLYCFIELTAVAGHAVAPVNRPFPLKKLTGRKPDAVRGFFFILYIQKEQA
ncbi:hypothetical protein CA264_03300 [Pontibacter actiniarum]|uniref:Uncharacterized protein n=1 Tax=Pontibacter actiniarum TaxID=323450 RepID=A0A1X9YNT2_9BACT|nr:hypothetical protein CA264_03300 [Pontibacter actiniarum]